MVYSQESRHFLENCLPENPTEQLHGDYPFKEDKKNILEKIFAHPFEQKGVLRTARQLLMQIVLVFIVFYVLPILIASAVHWVVVQLPRTPVYSSSFRMEISGPQTFPEAQLDSVSLSAFSA